MTTPDTRYTITHEYCGHQSQRYIVRFCRKWVGERTTKEGAEKLAEQHNAARMAAYFKH